jgi:DUF4097 and DUF4098 domain-containing protein YvlB
MILHIGLAILCGTLLFLLDLLGKEKAKSSMYKNLYELYKRDYEQQHDRYKASTNEIFESWKKSDIKLRNEYQALLNKAHSDYKQDVERITKSYSRNSLPDINKTKKIDKPN